MSQLIDLRKIAISLAIFAVVAFASAGAKADTVTFQLNQGSTLPSGNYGTITLTLNGTGGIDVSVSLLNNAKIINGGGDCSICFNSSLSPNPTIGATGLTANYGLISTTAGSLHADGFGFYEYGVNYLGSTGGACVNDSPNPCQSVVNFTVTRSGGTFSSVFNLVQNSTGGGIASPFAVDIGLVNANGAVVATGYVGTTAPVPEPTSMLLLGTGLLGVAGIARRRFGRK